jgi:hypothetical protein
MLIHYQWSGWDVHLCIYALPLLNWKTWRSASTRDWSLLVGTIHPSSFGTRENSLTVAAFISRISSGTKTNLCGKLSLTAYGEHRQYHLHVCPLCILDVRIKRGLATNVVPSSGRNPVKNWATLKPLCDTKAIRQYACNLLVVELSL